MSWWSAFYDHHNTLASMLIGISAFAAMQFFRWAFLHELNGKVRRMEQRLKRLEETRR